MAASLNIKLVENQLKSPSDARTIISLQKKREHWNVSYDDENACYVNQTDRKLKMTLYQAFQGEISVPTPTQDEIETLTKPRILIRNQIIDNPGKGNCGFYAFAIGLIHIIQEESTYKNKTMFERWLALDSSLLNRYDALRDFKFDHPDIALLNHLQSSLRLITHHGQLEELKSACTDPANDYQVLVGNSTYIKFAEFYYDRAVDRRFNEFAASSEIGSAFKKFKLEVIPNYEHLTLVPLFLSLIYGTDVNPKSITLETNPSDQSPVISAMGSITQDYFWGTHHDLNFLANIFKVNFHPLENGVARFPFTDLDDRPIITINNKNNIHWTTQITFAKQTSGFSFIECGVSLEKQSLINNAPLATLAKKKKNTKKGAIEGGSLGELQLASALTPAINHPLSSAPERVDVLAKSQKRNVRFHLSPSQLNDQRKHHMGLLDYELGKTSKKTVKPAEDTKQFEFLRGVVSQATIDYTEYSEGIWFSLFHRHGNTGRVRARNFHDNLLATENLTDAKANLIRFLSDETNGNTHPHSFRTMLLQKLQREPKTLQYTSEHFDEMLEELAAVLCMTTDILILQR
ncbi:hypothetical protein TUM19329_08930 [Legionella antarctica]|uniref:Dot/Icm T4SS effector n=1 Tax=Legionella antarctica TaxID=2708020 RepID=A0A6F8T3D4_9GAMM|nr:hypothetical protein [Legionella antarctica]BCA94532.1 hypothetical protein TUM19329_08930 [Legionella antarctica]